MSEPDLSAVAQLCTRFGRVATPPRFSRCSGTRPRVLDAVGLIVWVWDPLAEVRPALVRGYSDRVVARLPPVRRDADNPTAAAFRSADARAVGPGDRASEALVVPLLTPAGCAGVLAIAAAVLLRLRLEHRARRARLLQLQLRRPRRLSRCASAIHAVRAGGADLHADAPDERRAAAQQEFGKPIEIGSDVWVGGGAIILPGVTIGSGAVIGAGSVVTEAFYEAVVGWGVTPMEGSPRAGRPLDAPGRRPDGRRDDDDS